MHTIISESAAQGYARAVRVSSVAESADVVFAFGECMKDVSRTDCSRCLTVARAHISQCTRMHNASRAGAIYFDAGNLRYDDHEFFTGTSDATADYHVHCWGDDFDGDRDNLRENTDKLIKKLIVDARGNDGFSMASSEKGDSSVNGLVQCWRFANMSSCRECLMRSTEATSCLPKMEGRVINPLCYMRYSNYKIHKKDSVTDSKNNNGQGSDSGERRKAAILLIVGASFLVIMTLIIMLIAFICKYKLTEKKGGNQELTPLEVTISKSKAIFRYEALERATDNFNISNKLGQGVSSAVFKGVLEDGMVVAVKKVFYRTTEWDERFFNEINLVSSIQHKNLVKLLGWCITGSASFLVYEYIPNGSLEQYISDERIRQRLSWEIRYNILVGVAEGLTNLHEQYEHQIVHGEIKLSNVLLDENYEAKIIDFGLARLLPRVQSHLKTNATGTMGHISSEVMEKADVYSFGVVLIELVTGKRVGHQLASPPSILQLVWDLYKSQELPKAVDPILEGNFPIKKASRLLHIGLLCAQTSPDVRPRISMVVKMLKRHAALPAPTQPPYLKSGALSSPLAMALGIAGSRPGTPSNQSSDSNAITNEIEEEITESMC